MEAPDVYWAVNPEGRDAIVKNVVPDTVELGQLLKLDLLDLETEGCIDVLLREAGNLQQDTNKLHPCSCIDDVLFRVGERMASVEALSRGVSMGAIGAREFSAIESADAPSISSLAYRKSRLSSRRSMSETTGAGTSSRPAYGVTHADVCVAQADVGSHMQMSVLSGGLYKVQEQMWQKGPDATSSMEVARPSPS